MASPPYVQALEAAEFIMGPPAIKGISLWRGRGMESVRLLVEEFTGIVRERHDTLVVEHDFIASQTDNRRVFGDFGNVYEILDLPGHPDGQFRSDNIVSAVGRLQQAGSDGPLISVGTVLRHFPGKTSPLFRDRLIWPVVELNQLTPPDLATKTLDHYRIVVEQLLQNIGVPALTVRTDTLSAYGKLTYLVVAALPNGRPTVLATLYLLAEDLRSALGARQDVVDAGFTGKVLATAAMLHNDARGLAFPSTLAPVQLGITVAPGTDLADHGRRLAALRDAGIRFEVRRASASSRSHARAERAWHRESVPLVLGLDRTPGSVTICSRLPLRREHLSALPGPGEVRARLDRHDADLHHAAQRLLAKIVDTNVRTLCDGCAKHPDVPVFGELVPATYGRCDSCDNEAGRALFVSEEGRFY